MFSLGTGIHRKNRNCRQLMLKKFHAIQRTIVYIIMLIITTTKHRIQCMSCITSILFSILIWASKLNVILHLCVDFSETKKKILIQTLYVTLHTLLCSFLNIFFFYHLLLQSSQFNIFKNVLNAFLEKKKFLLRIWRIGLFSMHHWWWLWFKGRIPLFFAL